MKNLKKLLLTFALTFIICLGCVLPVACGDESGERLIIEGQKTAFYIGDEFTTGESFKVYLQNGKGEKVDVTAEATVKPESSLDMNALGSYAVTVSYQGKKEVYYIMVNDFNNVLKALKLNTENAKLNYQIGESISYEGLKVTGTYENAQKQEFDEEITSLRSLRFEVVSEYGSAYDDVFTAEGNYTVSVSKGAVSASYTVTVAGVNLSSVQNALSLGNFFKSNVVSGTSTASSYINKGWTNINYTYRFGDNYTYVKEDDVGYISEFHTSMKDDKIDVVYFYDGSQYESPRKSTEMMEGVFYRPWYFDSDKAAYGIEKLVTDMYDIGKTNPNKDYREGAELSQQQFFFSFGYLYPGGANRHYYFTVDVEFKLGNSYFIESATVLQKAWFSSDFEENKYSHFVTDSEGVTSPTQESPDFQWRITCQQVAGKRTEKNPFITEDEKTGEVQSYQIFYNGKEINDGDTIKFNRGNEGSSGHTNQITLTFKNILPEGSDFTTDPLFVTDGTKKKENSHNWFYGDDLYVFGMGGNTRLVEARRGGSMKLVFTTAKTTKTIYFDVTGSDPTSLTPRVYNPLTKFETTAAQKTIGVGETVYFSCEPNQYANGAYTAELSSGVTANVTLTPPDADAAADEIAADPTLKYWKFTASAAGTYSVKMTSTVKPTVSTTITFTVKEIDFAGLLSGTYSVKDNAQNQYSVTFTPESEGATSGRVAIVYTVKDGEPAETVYAYSVASGKIVLDEKISGDELGVTFSATVDKKLMLTDRYSKLYELKKS